MINNFFQGNPRPDVDTRKVSKIVLIVAAVIAALVIIGQAFYTIGEQEQADKLVSVRSRFEGNEGQKPLAQFIADIKEEIDSKAIRTELPEEEKKR